LIFTGAGVSAESGVATFRTGDDGLWYKSQPQMVGVEIEKKFLIFTI
jgi:NAD-dependent SIR2 family protein deacetylase